MSFWGKLFGKKSGRPSEKRIFDSCYKLQYVFIPEVVFAYKIGEFERSEFIDIDMWKSMCSSLFGKKFYFEWDSLGVEVVKMSGSYWMVRYSFPLPTKAPIAWYAAVLVNTETRNAQYYTMECADGGGWMLGSTAVEGRLSFGSLKTPTPEAFFAWVEEQARFL